MTSTTTLDTAVSAAAPSATRTIAPPNVAGATKEPAWVRWTLTGTALLFLSLFLFLPLVSVFYEAFKKGWEVYVAAVIEPDALSAVKLTLIAAVIAVPLNLKDFRRKKLTAPLLAIYQKIAPQLSPTEKIALEAGTVGFEGELFSGKPNWNRLLREPVPTLSADERAFLDGPVEELCRMVNDWEITHELADLPPPIWEFLKKHKFFGMIIPREYGGLQFSALAHSVVLQKLASISTTVGSTASRWRKEKGRSLAAPPHLLASWIPARSRDNAIASLRSPCRPCRGRRRRPWGRRRPSWGRPRSRLQW